MQLVQIPVWKEHLMLSHLSLQLEQHVHLLKVNLFYLLFPSFILRNSLIKNNILYKITSLVLEECMYSANDSLLRIYL